MFTGIIQSVGRWAHVEPRGGDLRVQVTCGGLDLSRAALGDSIAVNGVCLTIVELVPEGFAADVSFETLERTTLGSLDMGQPVNLEAALRMGDALGGHLVSGHVDGVAEVVSVDDEARGWRIGIEVPAELARYIARKGSVCIDGVSLTVGEVDGARFAVHIVPHTWDVTIMHDYVQGRRVNLEVDQLARYLQRLLESRDETESGGNGAN